jgi:hypothetical protein
MKLGILKRVSKEDLARSNEQLPQWLDSLLQPLNDFLEKAGNALQNRLSFEDNFYCKRVTLKFTDNVAQEISPRTDFAKNARAYGVLLVGSSGETVSTFTWEQLVSGNISVTVNFSSATDADCNLIILLGQ